MKQKPVLWYTICRLGGLQNVRNGANIWANDGTGKPVCIAAMSKRLFCFLLISYVLMIRQHKTNAESVMSRHLFISSTKESLLFVLKTMHHVLVVQLMKAYMDSEKDAASKNISQTKQTNMESRCMFWPSANSVCSKLKAGKSTHTLGLQYKTMCGSVLQCTP